MEEKIVKLSEQMVTAIVKLDTLQGSINRIEKGTAQVRKDFYGNGDKGTKVQCDENTEKIAAYDKKYKRLVIIMLIIIAVLSGGSMINNPAIWKSVVALL